MFVTLLAAALLAPADPPVADPGDVDRDGPVRVEARVDDARALGVGRWTPDLAFTDVDGARHTLDEALGDARALVVAVRDVACPLSRKYLPRLASLEQRFAADDVAWLYVHPGELHGADAIREAAETAGLTGHLAHDASEQLVAALGARTTTEAFVFDAARTLQYRGAVDDQYGIGFTRPEVRREYLAEALTAVLADRAPSVSATTAPGCVLELDDVELPREAEPVGGTPTWHRDVSRIVQTHCGACHRDGGVGPFPLQTYAEAEGRKGMIGYVVESGIMPPWHAAAGSGPWLNDRSLSEDDRDTLMWWLEEGCPEGDPADAPRPRQYASEWELGEPDAVYAMAKPYPVPVEGWVDYQYCWVDTDQTEDRWVEAIEVMPGDGRVVHHVLVFVEEPRRVEESREDYQRRSRGGLRGYFAAYVPGQGARVFGDGLAKKLPAGATLKLQLHYTPFGRPADDQTRIGLHFTDTPPKHEVHTSGVFNTRFMLPPGDPDVEVTASTTFGQDAIVSAFSPHMHLRGRSFRIELERPGQEREVVLDVPAYDFNWQTMYTLVEPVEVPEGSTLHATARFDNSANNPANPDPRAEVYFGEQTWDEMMIGYFEWWAADGS